MDILPQLLVNALISGSIYALVSSGLALVYGLLRVLNFAHGHIMMVGVYIFYFASAEMHWGLLNSAIFTLLFSIFFAVLVFQIFVLPFSKLSIMLTFVTTLALSDILEALISMGFGVNVKSLSTGVLSLEIWGIYITPIQILIILSSLSLLSLLAYVIHSTSIGRKIRALSEHPNAAESISISQRKTSYIVFIVGTLLSVYAGILIGFETNIQPTMGGAYTIKAFAAMILGGIGNIWGAVAGSYILGLVENLSIGIDFWGYSLPAGYKDAFAFAIILIVLLFRPQGLFGIKQRAA